MKKLLFVAVLGLIAFTSCSKEKTCVCTTSSNMTGSTAVSAEAVIKDGDCKDMNSSVTSGTYTTTTDCVEK